MDRLSGGFQRLSFNPLTVRKTSSTSFDQILVSGDPELVDALNAIAPFRIHSGLRRTERTAFVRGGYGDVYKGELLQGWATRKVAIKVLRFSGSCDFSRLLRRLAREIAIWSMLKHVNVLEFVGFEIKGGPNREESSLICPWMENGDLTSYLTGRPYCRRRRLLFLLDTLDGLTYLHSRGVYHGDLKAANILINQDIRAVLCDFGVSRYMEKGNLTTSQGFKGTMRWSSPEQLNSPLCIHTIAADAWSWAMTALEIMTDKLPYHEIEAHAKLCAAISEGDTPDPLKYPSLSACDVLWTVLHDCWKKDPESRSKLSVLRSQVLTLVCNKTTTNDLEPTDPLLRGYAVLSLERIIALYRKTSSDDIGTSLRQLATALVDLGGYMTKMGRHAEALEQHKEAVVVWQKLADQYQETFELELVESVQQLSQCLAAVGKWNEALSHAQDGVDMLQRLAKKDPDAFRPDRAASLRILSERLADLGHVEEALDVMEEAATLYAKPISSDFITFQLSYSSRLQDVGRENEALERARKAHELARALVRVEGDADRFQSTLANTLYRLSLVESKASEHDNALLHSRSAVEIWRKLAQGDAQAFRPRLAASLTANESCLQYAGLFVEATSVGVEGVKLWRELAEEEPRSYRADLSRALYGHTLSLWNVERYDSALENIKEAVDIQETLAHDAPDRLRPDLGEWCRLHSDCLGKTGADEEAIKAATKAVEVLKPFAGKRPDTFRFKYSLALRTLSNCLMKVGKANEALPHLRTAVELDDGVTGTGPVRRLDALASCLLTVGEDEQALQASKKAVRMARKYAQLYPNAFNQHWLATPLRTMSDCLMRCGRSDEGIQRGRESMDMYEQLARPQPESFLSEYVRSSENLISHLRLLKRMDEASQVEAQARNIQHKLSTI